MRLQRYSGASPRAGNPHPALRQIFAFSIEFILHIDGINGNHQTGNEARPWPRSLRPNGPTPPAGFKSFCGILPWWLTRPISSVHGTEHATRKTCADRFSLLSDCTTTVDTLADGGMAREVATC